MNLTIIALLWIVGVIATGMWVGHKLKQMDKEDE